MSRIIDNIVQRERKEVEKKSSIDTDLRMIDEVIFTVEQISEISTLPLEEVKELIKKHSA